MNHSFKILMKMSCENSLDVLASNNKIKSLRCYFILFLLLISMRCITLHQFFGNRHKVCRATLLFNFKII